MRRFIKQKVLSFIEKINKNAFNNRESYYGNDAAKFINSKDYNPDEYYEFCSKCEANLTLQKGYSNDLPYWVCKGCGEMLINPEIPDEQNVDDIAWICDKCSAFLNAQNGFSVNCGIFACTECGFENKISQSEIYLSDDEYQQSCKDPYRGLSDEAILELSKYEELECLGGRENIILVRNMHINKCFVKKYLSIYDKSIYEFLHDNPVAHMPYIFEVYESQNSLIVIEEYIEGIVLADLIKEPLEISSALHVGLALGLILKQLHGTGIIHRDIKPSNVIISPDGDVYLLDVNAAKWYDSEKTEDTELLGTMYYAAPEQSGYGFSASSEKTDIYNVGILLNVISTGELPKNKKADEPLWSIIEHCICLEANDRYSTEEYIETVKNTLNKLSN